MQAISCEGNESTPPERVSHRQAKEHQNSIFFIGERLNTIGNEKRYTQYNL